MSEVAWLVLTAIGGTAAVVGGLAAWLGIVWAKRIEQAEANKYAKEIESLKSELEKEKSREQRISEAKFKLYTEVWSCIQEVNMMES